MSEVCVSDAFTIVDGALGLAAWTGAVIARRRHHGGDVFENGVGEIPSLPGVELWDIPEAVVNESPARRLMVFRLQRPPVNLIVPQPNAMQIRDRWETRVAPVNGPPSIPTPREAAPDDKYNGAWTASTDSGTFSDGSTRKGRIYRYFPGSMVDVQVEVPPGYSAAIRWTGFVWTPPPWSNNADKGNATGGYGCGIPMITSVWLPIDGGSL